MSRFHSRLTGLTIGLFFGTALTYSTRKQIYLNSERVSQRLASVTLTKPKEDGILIPAALLPARQVLPIQDFDADDLITSAKSEIIHQWNTLVRRAHSKVVELIFNQSNPSNPQSNKNEPKTTEKIVQATTTTVKQ